MRIVVVLTVALAVLAGCGEEDDVEPPAAATPQLAELTVTLDKGEGAKPKTVEVRCAVGEASEVCRAVAGLEPKTFEPTPGTVACTQQYGGPETATVKGTVRGEEVDATFSRVNGCEIARWDAAKRLLEAAG